MRVEWAEVRQESQKLVALQHHQPQHQPSFAYSNHQSRGPEPLSVPIATSSPPASFALKHRFNSYNGAGSHQPNIKDGFLKHSPKHSRRIVLDTCVCFPCLHWQSIMYRITS